MCTNGFVTHIFTHFSSDLHGDVCVHVCYRHSWVVNLNVSLWHWQGAQCMCPSVIEKYVRRPCICSGWTIQQRDLHFCQIPCSESQTLSEQPVNLFASLSLCFWFSGYFPLYLFFQFFPDLSFSHSNFLFPQQVFLFNLNIFLYHFHGPGSQDFVCDLNLRLSMFLNPIPLLSFPVPSEIPTKADQMIWSNGLR